VRDDSQDGYLDIRTEANQEKLNEEATVKDQRWDQQLALVYQNPRKRQARGNVVYGTPEGLKLEKSIERSRDATVA
jgi:hypothetical protein